MPVNKQGRTVCRCTHTRADHVRGGGCRALKRDPQTNIANIPCPCDQYDATTPTIYESAVRGGIKRGGLEDDYK